MGYNEPRPAEIETPRGSNRLFGSSGIRGVVNQDLSLDFCYEISQAIGTTLPPHSKVCIGTDTRVSREIIKDAVISGLRSTGIDIAELGILPTPALAFLTSDMGFDTGIMITASHNPPEFNGIKLFNRDSIGYSRTQEADIEKIYSEKKFRDGYQGGLDQSSEVKERYLSFMLARFSNKSLANHLKIVVDPGNGAASGLASELLSRLHFDVLPLNNEPDGLFPGRNPEPKEDTLEGTVQFLRQQDADLAICFDGDADRVVFCDKEGFLGFNEVIAFISRLAVENNKKRKVATTVETGSLLDLSLSDLGVEIVRGMVGDVHVAHLVRELDAAIGVEPVGVYIMPEIGLYPDSMFAMLTLLSRIKEVSQIRGFCKDIPRLFLEQRKLQCLNHLKIITMNGVKENAHLFGADHVNMLDGVRFEHDNSWMLIRASGTEPAIRVIAESTSRAEAETLLNKGIQSVENILERMAK